MPADSPEFGPNPTIHVDPPRLYGPDEMVPWPMPPVIFPLRPAEPMDPGEAMGIAVGVMLSVFMLLGVILYLAAGAAIGAAFIQVWLALFGAFGILASTLSLLPAFTMGALTASFPWILAIVPVVIAVVAFRHHRRLLRAQRIREYFASLERVKSIFDAVSKKLTGEPLPRTPAVGVCVTYASTMNPSEPPLGPQTKALLDSLGSMLGVSQFEVTSTFRAPDQQAVAMYNNLDSDQRWQYGKNKAALAVQEVYKNYKNGKTTYKTRYEVISAMTKIIAANLAAYNGGNQTPLISYHLSSRALDIALPLGISTEKFKSCAKNLHIRVIMEGSHYHLTLPNGYAADK